MKTSISILAALASVALNLPAFAAFGDVDPAFSSVTGGCHVIVPQADGSAFVDGPITFTNGQPDRVSVSRVGANGGLDSRWGSGGSASYTVPSFGGLQQILVAKDGSLFASDRAGIVHLTPSGQIDTAYGVGGRVSLPFIAQAAMQDDGRIAVLTAQNGGATFMRVTADGRIDPSFGHGGSLYVPLIDGSKIVYGWAVRSDGGVEVGLIDNYGQGVPTLRAIPVDGGPVPDLGTRIVPQGIATWMSLLRVDARGGVVIVNQYTGLRRYGNDGLLDASFGNGGIAALPYPFTTPISLWQAPDGGWILVGIGTIGGIASYIGDTEPRAIRFDARGVFDTAFGMRYLKIGTRPINPYSPVTRAFDGAFLAPDVDCMLRKVAADTSRVEGMVVEYYHADLDHYFMTSSPNEIAGLDSNPLGWFRTGQTFGDWTPANLPGAAHVCRFYGDPVIGPNSHFYTGEDFECQGLIDLDAATPRGSPAWHLEAKPFDIAIPSGGACPANLQPVYRVFNGPASNGHGPNHRYTTDPAVYAAMQAKGWLPEGVHFCAPPRSN